MSVERLRLAHSIVVVEDGPDGPLARLREVAR